MIRKVEQKDWGLVAELISKDTDFLQGLLNVENSHKWLVEILQNKFAYIVENSILIVTKDISQHIKLIDDGNPQKSKLKVIYYCIPYDEKAVVEYVSELQNYFQMELESFAIGKDFNTNGKTKQGKSSSNTKHSTSHVTATSSNT